MVCAKFYEKDHTLAGRIAREFGVNLDQIIEKFCAGYGFGEIELAYSIAKKSGVSVEDVFAKRDIGDGWGNIMKEFWIRGNPKSEILNPGQRRAYGK